MSFNAALYQHGYRMPIPRSPKIEFAPELQEIAPTCSEEELPGKYAYMEIMGAERQELKKQFMRNCNQARWQHIRNAEIKAKK